jgi:hypothetical protein
MRGQSLLARLLGVPCVGDLWHLGQQTRSLWHEPGHGPKVCVPARTRARLPSTWRSANGKGRKAEGRRTERPARGEASTSAHRTVSHGDALHLEQAVDDNTERGRASARRASRAGGSARRL